MSTENNDVDRTDYKYFWSKVPNDIHYFWGTPKYYNHLLGKTIELVLSSNDDAVLAKIMQIIDDALRDKSLHGLKLKNLREEEK